MDLLGNFLSMVPFNDCNIVLALEAQPKLGIIPKEASESNGGISGKPAATIEDVGDSAGWYTNGQGEAVGA